jgi:hypothetical protein
MYFAARHWSGALSERNAQLHSCRFKGTRLLADNPNSRCHFYFWRPAIVITGFCEIA